MKPLVYAFIFVLGAQMCFAQESKQAERNMQERSGFEWLKQFEGDWATAYSGTMSSRLLGERWLVNEFSVAGVTAIQTIGFDAKKDQFVGTWIDTTSSFIWQYTGSLDSSGRILILEAEGPDLNDPTRIRKYRDTYEFNSENEIAAISKMLNDKGEWQTFNDEKMTREDK